MHLVTALPTQLQQERPELFSPLRCVGVKSPWAEPQCRQRRVKGSFSSWFRMSVLLPCACSWSADGRTPWRQECGQLSYLRAEWKWKIGVGWKERERDTLRAPSDLLHLVISCILKSQSLLERRHQLSTEVLLHEPFGGDIMSKL